MSSFSIHKAALEGETIVICSEKASLTISPGQPGLVRSILSEDAKAINAKDDDGRTALHWAATTPSLSMTQLLLNYSPDIEAKDSMGWTALMVASAAAGHYDIVNELLHAGAKVDAINEKGQTSLHYAASKGNVQINAKDRASQFPLHRAATTGSNAFLQLLLNPPEGRPKTRLNGADRAGNTPLHLAVESGHGDAAVILIEAGADRERTNSEGQVPEEIDGVGGEEQKRVRQYIVSRVGPRRE
ncbi:putative proteolysis and peptidolysis-related protein [Papiliotrema laurentii]|uniref:Proteolysis and peptidolysis-related protein n=1 Tax=Papiliotrema laurentii TaxID=5418 RepID=A0AAD9FU25_PAPLA|nr:putative proteolysis and peptidolysis-related protein [Papiliotrema laurentii]